MNSRNAAVRTSGLTFCAEKRDDISLLRAAASRLFNASVRAVPDTPGVATDRPRSRSSSFSRMSTVTVVIAAANAPTPPGLLLLHPDDDDDDMTTAARGWKGTATQPRDGLCVAQLYVCMYVCM